ncbi:MAG: PepSY domain-containing protein, partial [Bacteroidales bacterium]|nr:PepSY domain-containing protein [Bacteroidales bacterium]
YHNWNLAAIRGGVPWGTDSLLVYGNIGIWLTDNSFSAFSDLNSGFPDGIDNRKVASVSVDPVTGIHAGTLFGLYRFDPDGRRWDKVPMPVNEERIVKVLAKGDSLLVMTRSHLLVSRIHDTGLALQNREEPSPGVEGSTSPEALTGSVFTVIRVPAGAGDDGKTGLFKTLWVIHSGEIYGLAGKLMVDAVGVIFIILCITGLIYFFVPYRLKKLRDGIGRSRLKRFNRNTLRWHNTLGSWTILLLILTTLTGMFLRPPLLIPIANARVGKIPYTELADPNPWFDRFRDLLWDDTGTRWLVATSEGIYQADPGFSTHLMPFPVQPPVSVMGINLFQQVDPFRFLIGSFSGIFLWEPQTGRITDYFTKMPYRSTGRGTPFGEISVAGYLNPTPGPSPSGKHPTPKRKGSFPLFRHPDIQDLGNNEVLFDYMSGAIYLFRDKWFPPMPEEMISKSPISLWSVALEIHTCRIFEPLLGAWYILVVPLVGLFTLEISIVGFLVWWRSGRRK